MFSQLVPLGRQGLAPACIPVSSFFFISASSNLCFHRNPGVQHSLTSPEPLDLLWWEYGRGIRGAEGEQKAQAREAACRGVGMLWGVGAPKRWRADKSTVSPLRGQVHWTNGTDLCPCLLLGTISDMINNNSISFCFQIP